MAPSTMKVKVVALPEGKHLVRTGEILDKTTVDLEQGTAGVQKALIAIQAPEPGVQYIPLVPVAIPTASASGGVHLTGTATLQGQRSTTCPAEEVDALDSHAQGVDTSRAPSLEIEVCERSVLSETSREG